MTKQYAIYPKDLQKGDVVGLHNGWFGEVKGKAKGIRIFLLVHGYATEMGDVYTRDLAYRRNPDGTRTPIILEDKHRKQFDKISAAGF